ncbi:MAG: hypothetical protein JXA69_19715 [Phycisphaerae bacterium]|nr:hypothetical protein [Phycisphaerae bacterium]
MGLLIIAIVLMVSVGIVFLKGFTIRTFGIVAIVLASGVSLILLNGYLTQRHARRVIARMDLMALAYFAGPYAAEHDDSLPQSWEQLVAEGYVQPDPKAAARFKSYARNPIEHPSRLRWIPGAKLSAYVVNGGRVLDRATSQPARLIWLDGVSPAECDEVGHNVSLLKTWRKWKERQASGSTTRRADR